MNPWVGVDLDGTLAVYDGWQGPDHIGPPIPAMVERVRLWLTYGHPKYGDVEVRIVTARAYCPEGADPWEHERGLDAIHAWCRRHLGRSLAVTCTKDYGMVELWDDRCVQVEANTGRRMDGQPEPEGPA